MQATGINHVSITATDLDASVHFYTEVFGMERLPAPKFAGLEVAWLRLGDQQLHLLQRGDPARFQHFGMNVDDFEAAYLKVRQLEIRDDETFMRGIVELPGGEAQMYLRDPAGNLIEVNWRDASTLDPSIVTDIVKLEDLVPQDAVGRSARLYFAAPDGSEPQRLGES
jgi:YD repeat-containing protein